MIISLGSNTINSEKVDYQIAENKSIETTIAEITQLLHQKDVITDYCI